MKKTQTKNLLTARDKYLRKKFEITEAEYEAQLAKQGGGCKICGRLPTGKALHVDHDHSIERTKVFSQKSESGGWSAWIIIKKQSFDIMTEAVALYETAHLKSAAIGKVRKQLKRISIRGILCWKCNTSLKKFNDNPVLMQNSATYILSYLEKVKQGRNGFE